MGTLKKLFGFLQRNKKTSAKDIKTTTSPIPEERHVEQKNKRQHPPRLTGGCMGRDLRAIYYPPKRGKRKGYMVN